MESTRAPNFVMQFLNLNVTDVQNLCHQTYAETREINDETDQDKSVSFLQPVPRLPVPLIVSRGTAGFKGNDKRGTIYAEHTTTVHNLLFFRSHPMAE